MIYHASKLNPKEFVKKFNKCKQKPKRIYLFIPKNYFTGVHTIVCGEKTELNYVMKGSDLGKMF